MKQGQRVPIQKKTVRITFRLQPYAAALIQVLVASGQVESPSQFIRDAVMERLQKGEA